MAKPSKKDAVLAYQRAMSGSGPSSGRVGGSANDVADAEKMLEEAGVDRQAVDAAVDNGGTVHGVAFKAPKTPTAAPESDDAPFTTDPKLSPAVNIMNGAMRAFVGGVVGTAIADAKVRREMQTAQPAPAGPQLPDGIGSSAAVTAPQPSANLGPLTGPGAAAKARALRTAPPMPEVAPAPQNPALPDGVPQAAGDAVRGTGERVLDKGIRAAVPLILDQQKAANQKALTDAATKNFEAGQKAAREQAVKQNDDRPFFSKQDEQMYRYQQQHGSIPSGKIFSGSTNEEGDISVIPGHDRENWNLNRGANAAKDPKTGLTRSDIWNKQFGGEGTTDWRDLGNGRVSKSGLYEERGIGPEDKPGEAGTGRWVQQAMPGGNVIAHHFGITDEKGQGDFGKWAALPPEQKAAMIRKDAGIAEPGAWVTPDDTAKEVGANAYASASVTPSSGPYAGQQIENVQRTVSRNGQIVGFARNGPSLPANPAIATAKAPAPVADDEDTWPKLPD